MSSVISKAQFEALKARATRLQYERPSLKRSQALDLVAQEHGFSNWSLVAKVHYSALSRAVPAAPKKKPHLLQIRAIVRSRERGVPNKWWDEYVPAMHPESFYEAFKWLPEHLQIVYFEEPVVRSRVSKARRIIEFIDAAELKPSKAWVRLWGHYPERRPKGMDHNAVWRDSQKRLLVTTEPYGGERTIQGLRAWCEEHGWKIAVARQGAGMWNPCPNSCPPGCGVHSRMVLMAPAKHGGDPVAIASRL